MGEGRRGYPSRGDRTPCPGPRSRRGPRRRGPGQPRRPHPPVGGRAGRPLRPDRVRRGAGRRALAGRGTGQPDRRPPDPRLPAPVHGRARPGHDGGGGYRLGVDPDDLDASRFQRLVDESASAPADRALALLDEATALWNGDAAFAEAWDVEAVHTEALRLEELRLVAEERRMRRLLELGRDEEAVGGLEAFVSRYPLRERALGLLMEALARTGRQTEALRRYAQHREWLAEETGLEPSAELQEVERVVLAGDLAAAPAPPGTGPSVELPLPVRPRSVERRRGSRSCTPPSGRGPV
ncbi:MAG: AfsR/SARP family transcriptional regulator [Acidimicrobiia bacterium]|nr:AfsR/SARP family transcriptional regulator [Acidimicrobiia bacterium]